MNIITAGGICNDFNVAIVISRFNNEVTELMYQGAIQRLQELDFSEEQITVAWVPGAIEIPIVAQRLIKSGRFQAVIALGAVIRGETTHYDYVCKQVSDGCQQLALQHDVPVIFGVLTTEDTAQALDRLGGNHGHKAKDAVDCAVEMVSTLRKIKDLY